MVHIVKMIEYCTCLYICMTLQLAVNTVHVKDLVETNNGILCYFSFSFNPASVTSLNKLAKDIISSESKKVSVFLYLPTAVCARFSVTRENAVLLNMPLEKLKLRSTIIAQIPWIFCCEQSQNITVHKYICTVIIRITTATFNKFLVLKVRRSFEGGDFYLSL